MTIARAAFSTYFGRFHADPRIGHDQATRLYEEWIRACLDGWADSTLVAVQDCKIAAYLAWKNPSAMDLRHGIRVADYNITGVEPAFAGRGLFTALTQEGVRLLRGHADYIEGATHIDNHAVQRAYLRLGWRIASAEHSFHKWLTP
jgi:GNAT superfamily N-acetyltransferase